MHDVQWCIVSNFSSSFWCNMHRCCIPSCIFLYIVYSGICINMHNVLTCIAISLFSSFLCMISQFCSSQSYLSCFSASGFICSVIHLSICVSLFSISVLVRCVIGVWLCGWCEDLRFFFSALEQGCKSLEIFSLHAWVLFPHARGWYIFVHRPCFVLSIVQSHFCFQPKLLEKCFEHDKAYLARLFIFRSVLSPC